VTTSGYTEPLETRTKVGDATAAGRIGLLTLATGAVRWLDALGVTGAAPADLTVIGWNEPGDAALFFAASADWTTRVLQRVDGASGALTALETLRDTAWVNGPCSECAGWYDAGRRAWYVSEADGYAHLYTVAAGGGDRQRLTRGAWEVLDVALAPDGRRFLLHTSEGSPFERHAYFVGVAGGARTRLTGAVGGHAAVLSPDGSRLADVASRSNRPPELFVQDARAGAAAAALTTSPTADFLAQRWLDPEIVMVPATDGVPVPGRIYRPQDVGATPNGAAVIFVHGAGYLHNVHRWWSTYAREYMFHHLLAARGYVVLDLDYRGSAGYGRDWRAAIYRHMGGRDLQDHVDGSRWLQRTYGIPAERVGIYGGSYGGFITLMALFTAPKEFGAGAALRSVTDWAHYNQVYTARILNEPQGDTLAFRRSSPIYFAEGLEDPLLIAHGMVDVNVHFQDVVRLSERLIELGKTDWELAVYPVEDHAFVRPTSWTDEYRRIYELFERHLPARVPLRGTVGAGGAAPR
jgi:dipeptidyl aminopeptidase/acylaminoacyl peptidase